MSDGALRISFLLMREEESLVREWCAFDACSCDPLSVSPPICIESPIPTEQTQLCAVVTDDEVFFSH